MNTETLQKCPECGAYKGHGIECSRQDWKETALRYYNIWLSGELRDRVMRARLVAQVVFWQGKFTIVRHENNMLRKKLRTPPSGERVET